MYLYPTYPPPLTVEDCPFIDAICPYCSLCWMMRWFVVDVWWLKVLVEVNVVNVVDFLQKLK
ncbi:MAG: hypothetical protein F6K48_14025 [Okeania sp. SIO3H1]|nr:hypothetical protein [Okeania sp. SIO3H1]